MINWKLIVTETANGNLPAGAVLTLCITAGAVAIGIVVGLVIAMMRLNARIWLRIPAQIYIEAFRGTPMLVQIYLFYFGVFPMLGLSRLSAVWPAIVAIGLNSGAYMGEIFRGGILSIDKGQREAALSLGMKNHQVMGYVILPQALTNALPAICNEFITLIKDSSLGSAVAVAELTYRAYLVASRTYEHFTMFTGIAIYYFIMTFVTSRILAVVEKRMRKGHAA